MANLNFGFTPKTTDDCSSEDLGKDVLDDIENYWGKECLATSEAFVLTLS